MRSWWPWPGRRGCGAAGGFMTAPSSSPWSHVRCAPELWCRPAWDRWCSVPETPNGGPWGEPSTSPVTPVPITGWRWLQGFWNPGPAASWRRGSASGGNELPTSKGPIEHEPMPSTQGRDPMGRDRSVPPLTLRPRQRRRERWPGRPAIRWRRDRGGGPRSRGCCCTPSARSATPCRPGLQGRRPLQCRGDQAGGD